MTGVPLALAFVLPSRKEKARIDRHGIEINAEMQMRPGDPARCAYSADAGAGCNTIAGCDFDHAEVGIQRKKTAAVVEYHGISRKEVIADIDHL